MGVAPRMSGVKRREGRVTKCQEVRRESTRERKKRLHGKETLEKNVVTQKIKGIALVETLGTN